MPGSIGVAGRVEARGGEPEAPRQTRRRAGSDRGVVYGRSFRDYAEVTRTTPEKSLVEGLKKSGGRNSNGRKTARHRGGGAKRLYRKIDFKRRKDGIPAKVAHIEYDPNRSAYIALLHYVDGEKRYILAPQRLRVGMTVQSGPGADIRVGNSLPLGTMPAGTVVHNVELTPGRGGQMARAAGAGVQLLAKEGDHVTLRLPSGEMRMVRGRVPRRPWAPSATPTTRTCRSARPDASATWACDRRPAAPR